MIFRYGKADWRTRERGQENGYLVPNGLGGFAAGTAIGSCSRADHAVLMAAVTAPNVRVNLVHRLREELFFAKEQQAAQGCEENGSDVAAGVFLSAQDYVDGARGEMGEQYLDAFVYEDFPTWYYRAQGVAVTKELAVQPQENRAVLRYGIDNRSGRAVTLAVTPELLFAPKGEDLQAGQAFSLEQGCAPSVPGAGEPLCAEAAGVIRSQRFALAYRTDGAAEPFAPRVTAGLYYAADACDGRRGEGHSCACVRFTQVIPAGETRYLHVSLRALPPCQAAPDGGQTARPETSVRPAAFARGEAERGDSCAALVQAVLAAVRSRHAQLLTQAGAAEPLTQALVQAADAFVVRRASTGGMTILAGYPFFADWGRDTMIALPGVCLETGRYEDARSILRTFAAHCRQGLMPNLFPEGGAEPMYNTADAALLFIRAVWLYVEKTKDRDFAWSMWPVMRGIIEAYRDGTAYAIHMDEDGLIAAGSGLDQVTWMDVRVGDILPTPRHGKPVEINAYWYNALRMMEHFGTEGADEDIAFTKRCGRLADRVRANFRAKFWNAEAGCLYDVLPENGAADAVADSEATAAARQIRCNQIWAVSMPFSLLEEAEERRVVDVVYEKLYTPYGLRSLDMADPAFHPAYGGSQFARDMAYHQGTVWAFPLGAFYLAYLKVHRRSPEAVRTVRAQLAMLESALREGCAGQLPEIYDGAVPTASRGCYAQAWSVGELLCACAAVTAGAP